MNPIGNNLAYLGVFSVILPNPLFMMWCPYRNCCSAEAFTQIWDNLANKANGSHCFLLSRVSQNCFFYTIMDLVLSIGCKEVESSDVEAELARFCELS